MQLGAVLFREGHEGEHVVLRFSHQFGEPVGWLSEGVDELSPLLARASRLG